MRGGDPPTQVGERCRIGQDAPDGTPDQLRRGQTMTDGVLAYLTPEARARVEIDRMLGAAGWVVQDAPRVEPRPPRGAWRSASSS